MRGLLCILQALALPAVGLPPAGLAQSFRCSNRWTDPWQGSLPNFPISAIVELPPGFPGGSGWVIAGSFSSIGGVACRRLALWDGEQWHPFGSGADGAVNALAVFDDGTGPALYVGGRFMAIDNVPASMVARWDGNSWSQVGEGLGFPGETGILSFEVFDEGEGPRLFAAGPFSIPLVASGLARWDGSSWTKVGPFTTTGGSVLCVSVHDDGLGPALYIGGEFTSIGGVPATRGVARWNGASWSSVGNGVTDAFFSVLAIESDTATSPAQLVVGGNFATVGGVIANDIARWDGVSWHDFPGLEGYPTEGVTVFDLHTHDNGEGASLFVAGRFAGVDGLPSRNIARWDGDQWHGLTGGTSGGSGGFGTISTMASATREELPVLLVGGYFTMVDGQSQPYLAAWQGCAAACVGDLDGDGLVNFTDLNLLLDDYNQTGPGLPGDLDGDMDVDFADLNLLLGAYNSEC